jgi:hypothetical protein
MRTLSPLAFALGVALAAATAAAPAFAEPAAASDVVLLKNGGLLRGTISEYVPGSHVVLVTVAGETKRLGAAEVTYAGPAAGAPGAARGGGRAGPMPLVTVNAAEAPLRLRSDQGDVTFYVRTGESTGSAVTTGFGFGFGSRGSAVMPSTAFTSVHGRSYGRICVAPCEATVPAGSYMLALSKGGGSPIEAEEMVRVNGPSTLQGAYTSYAALRTAGIVVTVASLATGLYLAFTSFDRDAGCDEGDGSCGDVDTGRLLVGAGVVAGGSIVGGILAAKSDEVSIQVLPASAGALPWRAAAGGREPGRAPAAGALPGVSVAMTF